jgi:hypothetical protein
MTSLRSMPLEGNPLKQIRRELVAGPMSALMKHLESRIPELAGGAGNGPSSAGGAARSGNLFGADEAQLAADAARMICVSAAAHAAGNAAPVPSRWGVAPPPASSSAASAPRYGSPAGGLLGAGGGGGPQQFGPGAAGASSSVPERELSLRRAGLLEVPAEVWQAAGASENFPPHPFSTPTLNLNHVPSPLPVRGVHF